MTDTRSTPARRRRQLMDAREQGLTEYRLVLCVLALGLAAVLVLMRDATGAGDLARLFGRSAP
jgi:hypothetical protein